MVPEGMTLDPRHPGIGQRGSEGLDLNPGGRAAEGVEDEKMIAVVEILPQLPPGHQAGPELFSSPRPFDRGDQP